MPIPTRYLALTMVFLSITSLPGQEDLTIFGYFQSTFQYGRTKFSMENQTLGVSEKTETESKSFLLQQLNVFFRKNIAADFSIWVNFEFTNSFSSARKWGTFSLEEAWLRYRQSNQFMLKAGLLIPKFNSLNEVKNRTPYLPYIFRPLVYESSFSDVVGNLEDYVPHRAYLQGYGEIDITHDAALEYTLYVGDAEADFHADADTPYALQTGVDTTMIFLLGGRLGVSTRDFRFGTSVTLDKDNLSEAGLGSVRRVRIGGDLSVMVSRLTLEGEVIFV